VGGAYVFLHLFENNTYNCLHILGQITGSHLLRQLYITVQFSTVQQGHYKLKSAHTRSNNWKLPNNANIYSSTLQLSTARLLHIKVH
jgi:hypothetical protein